MTSLNLAYNEYITNLTGGLHLLLESTHNADVTFAVEGQFIKAHQIVLSMFSSYFKELFASNPCPHPIFFLKDVSYRCMKDILTFIYAGNVQIAKDEFQIFVDTAIALKVKGLKEVPESTSAPEPHLQVAEQQPEQTQNTNTNVSADIGHKKKKHKHSLKRRFDNIDSNDDDEPEVVHVVDDDNKSDKSTMQAPKPAKPKDTILLPLDTEIVEVAVEPMETIKFEEHANSMEFTDFSMQIPDAPRLENHMTEDHDVERWCEALLEEHEYDEPGETVLVKSVKSQRGYVIVLDNNYRFFGKKTFGGNSSTKRIRERWNCSRSGTGGCRAIAWLTDDGRIAFTNEHTPFCAGRPFRANDIVLGESTYRLTTKTLQRNRNTTDRKTL